MAWGGELGLPRDPVLADGLVWVLLVQQGSPSPFNPPDGIFRLWCSCTQERERLGHVTGICLGLCSTNRDPSALSDPVFSVKCIIRELC